MNGSNVIPRRAYSCIVLTLGAPPFLDGPASAERWSHWKLARKSSELDAAPPQFVPARSAFRVSVPVVCRATTIF